MSIYEGRSDNKNHVYFYHGQPYNTPAHFHNAIEFLFVEKGEQPVTIGGDTLILPAGTGCFMDSFCIHSLPRKDTITWTLTVERSFFESTFALFNGCVPPKTFPFDNYDLLRTIRSLCHAAIPDGTTYATYTEKNEESNMAILTGAMSVLLGAIAEKTRFVPRKVMSQNSLVCDILTYASSNLSGDLSLIALSNVFHYSKEHLSRLLGRYITEGWNNYVNRLRVRKTDLLIKSQTKMSVLECAFACGFESSNTFYRAYKKEFGVSPRHASEE